MMTIGVANVSDVLAARAAGTTVTLSDPQTVTLTAGLNDLTLAPLAVGENQTIVFGAPGGDTAALLSFEELPTADDSALSPRSARRPPARLISRTASRTSWPSGRQSRSPRKWN